MRSTWSPDSNIICYKRAPEVNSEETNISFSMQTLVFGLGLIDSTLNLACVASISIWFRSKERPVLATREMKWEPKNVRGGGGGEGRKRLQTNPSILKTGMNAATDWLGYSNNIVMCRSKVCFILRGHLWYMTRTLWLLFSLVGKIYSPCFETQSSSCE